MSNSGSNTDTVSFSKLAVEQLNKISLKKDSFERILSFNRDTLCDNSDWSGLNGDTKKRFNDAISDTDPQNQGLYVSRINRNIQKLDPKNKQTFTDGFSSVVSSFMSLVSNRNDQFSQVLGYPKTLLVSPKVIQDLILDVLNKKTTFDTMKKLNTTDIKLKDKDTIIFSGIHGLESVGVFSKVKSFAVGSTMTSFVAVAKLYEKHVDVVEKTTARYDFRIYLNPLNEKTTDQSKYDSVVNEISTSMQNFIGWFFADSRDYTVDVVNKNNNTRGMFAGFLKKFDNSQSAIDESSKGIEGVCKVLDVLSKNRNTDPFDIGADNEITNLDALIFSSAGKNMDIDTIHKAIYTGTNPYVVPCGITTLYNNDRKELTFIDQSEYPVEYGDITPATLADVPKLLSDIEAYLKSESEMKSSSRGNRSPKIVIYLLAYLLICIVSSSMKKINRSDEVNVSKPSNTEENTPSVSNDSKAEVSPSISEPSPMSTQDVSTPLSDNKEEATSVSINNNNNNNNNNDIQMLTDSEDETNVFSDMDSGARDKLMNLVSNGDKDGVANTNGDSFYTGGGGGGGNDMYSWN